MVKINSKIFILLHSWQTHCIPFIINIHTIHTAMHWIFERVYLILIKWRLLLLFRKHIHNLLLFMHDKCKKNCNEFVLRLQMQLWPRCRCIQMSRSEIASLIMSMKSSVKVHIVQKVHKNKMISNKLTGVVLFCCILRNYEMQC